MEPRHNCIIGKSEIISPPLYTASMNLFAVNQGFETEFNGNRNRMTAVEF